MDDGSIPGDGRGAGGYDSSLFLHLCRNWHFTKKVKKVIVSRVFMLFVRFLLAQVFEMFFACTLRAFFKAFGV